MMRPADHDRITGVLFYGALATLTYLVFLVVEPFFVPLGWAGVLAIVFNPVYSRLERRWGSGRAAALSTMGAAIIVIVPLILVMSAFVGETVQAVGDLQRAFAEGRLAWIQTAWGWIERRAPGVQGVDIVALAVDGAQRLASFAAVQTGAVLQNVAAFVLNLVIALFATFFLFRDSRAIVQTLRRALPLDEKAREHLLLKVQDVVSASVTSAGIVALVQGLLGGLSFALVGIDAPVFWGVVMAFFCLLPFGAWVVWLPAALMLGASGALWRGVILAGLGFGIVSAVDNVLRPALLSGRAQLNGLLIFISLLGGMRVFGSLGLVLGPLLVATMVGVVRAYTTDDGDEAAGE